MPPSQPERTTSEWLELCEREGIPANPVPNIEEILANGSLHRGMIRLAEHPAIGSYRVVGPGMILDATPVSVRRPAPRRSEHTVEVLAEVGYTAEEIAALVAEGAASVQED